MENVETSDQSIALQVNGVAVDMDVIAKDADIELNNNETAESAEKMVDIAEPNLMEKLASSPSSLAPVDEHEKESEPRVDAPMAVESGSESDATEDKPLGGDSEVEQIATMPEEKFDSCSSSSAASVTDETTADSESSTTTKMTENLEQAEKSDVEDTASETVTSATGSNEGQAEASADTDERTEQTDDKTEQPATDAPSQSPTKKKSSPKKRKNRSRAQKKSFDYSQYMDYTLSVSPRQRRYFLNTPRGRNVPVPADDCEIFCTNIPINVREQELIPLFEKFGKIFELRLMMSLRNPKRNAGFAFVRYTTDLSAKETTEKLNNYEIVPGKLLSVRLSQPNLSLFVGNIHRGLTREQIHEKIGSKTKGLVKTFVKSSLYEETKNCGFCFLEFDCHASALNAKRLLNQVNVWGRHLFVDWAQRRQQINEGDLQDSKTLFINNLPKETTDQHIIDTMSPFGTIEKVTKIKDYAFVLFTEHQAAMDAMTGTDKARLGTDLVEISLAMPKVTKHRNRVPSFSHRRLRFNRRRTNSYNRYRSTFGSSNNFFVHKQSTGAPNTDAGTSGMAAGQTVIPSVLITSAEPIVVS